MENKDLKILWIDDENDILEVANSIIIKSGFTPLLTNSAVEGLKIFNEEMDNIAFVICDYLMPDMNGLEFRKKTLPHGESVPFGIASGDLNKPMSLEVESLKICGFYEKPFKIDELISIIKKESENRVQFLKESKILENIFIEEAKSNLDDMEVSLLSLDKDRTNQEILKVISRCAHTIKGSSGSLSNNIITKYVHKYEDLVAALQKNQLQLTNEIYDILFKGFDRIKELVNSISNKKINTFNLELILPEVTLNLEKENKTKNTETVLDNTQIKNSQIQKVKDNISVPIYMLDELTGYSGEITVLRNMVNKIILSLETKYNDNKDIQNLGELFDEMNKINSTIQNRITELCKVPLFGVLKPIPRIIRDLSKELGKNIQLIIEGENLRVANSLVEVCSNSLIHLVRNSADHGIELPEERIKCSKSEQGEIKITCIEDNNEVIISIIDDGRGLDPIKIKEKAIEKELFSEKQLSEMTNKQIYEIIFSSGFSTAAKLTDISGRGVGMDMVKSSVESVGGKIEIDSKVGFGTIFKLKLPKPKSVLIINSLLIECAGRIFAIPEDSIVCVIRIEHDKFENMVQSLSKGKILRKDNIIYPLIDLKNVLKLPLINSNKMDLEILILKSEYYDFALQVDGILNSEEIVLKRLNPCFNYKGIYFGATFMGDGSIGLILDINNIAKLSGISMSNKIERMKKAISNKIELNLKQFIMNYLLFKIDSKSIFGIPLEIVFRIEEIDKTKIQYCGDNKVVTYREGVMPIYSMENLLKLYNKLNMNDEVKGYISVIVIKNAEGYIGIEVPEILDIAEAEDGLHQEVKDRIGVLGNTLIQNKNVTIIDIPSVLTVTNF